MRWLFLFLLLPVLAFANPEPKRIVTPLGIEAWFFEDRSLPIIHLRMAWRGGASLDPENKAGMTRLMAALLDEGAGEYSAKAFQKELARHAIHLGFSTGSEFFSGSMKTLSKNRVKAFHLLSESLRRPTFEGEAVGRMKASLLSLLAYRQQSPSYIATQKWYELAFPDHPYALPLLGTRESVESVTAEELRKHHKDMLSRDRLMIAVVGDIRAEELIPLLDKSFGGLPAKAGLPFPNPVKLHNRKMLHHIERDTRQASAIFGLPGIARDDEDFVAAFVMNYILGGDQLSSRLAKTIRVERGLTYSVYSYLYPLSRSPLWFAHLASDSTQIEEAIGLLKKEMEKAQDISEEELRQAKQYLIGSYPLRFSSGEEIADQLIGLQMQNLPLEYMQKRNGYIEAVGLADIRHTAKRVLHPRSMLTVIIGP